MLLSAARAVGRNGRMAICCFTNSVGGNSAYRFTAKKVESGMPAEMLVRLHPYSASRRPSAALRGRASTDTSLVPYPNKVTALMVKKVPEVPTGLASTYYSGESQKARAASRRTVTISPS